MEYPVIIEQKNGVYRALVPALADLSAEASSSDEAVQKVKAAAEAYLAKVEFRTINVSLPVRETQVPYPTADDWLEAVEVFAGDEEALRDHFAELEAERQRQRTEAKTQDVE